MPNRHFFFYADANPQIGGGHLTRALQLAREIQVLDAKAQITFIHRDLSTEFAQQVEFPQQAIDPTDWESFWDRTERLDQKMLVLDTDAADLHAAAFQTTLEERGWRTAYFTVNDNRSYSCDFLINPNILALSQNYKVASHTHCLFGPGYFIYAPAFRSLQPRTPQDQVKRVLVSFGNADPQHYTLAVLGAIDALPALQEWEWEVVVGGLSPDWSTIKAYVAQRTLPVRLHHATKEMQRTMSGCQLAISSLGTTWWELALLGVRSLIIPAAPREEETAKLLHKNAYAQALSLRTGALPKDLGQDILRHLQQPQQVAPALLQLQEQIRPDGIGAIARVLSGSEERNKTTAPGETCGF